jgi:acyl-CoA dehydrogenase family member 9
VSLGLNITDHFQQNFSNFRENDLIKIRSAKTVCAEYALESMIYLTAGLCDNYDAQDVELEAAILKVFAVENALRTAIEPFYTFGPGSLLADNPIVENARNAMQMLAQGETLDSLKVFIALSGLQHAGVST